MSPHLKIWLPHAVAWLGCIVLIALVWVFTFQSINKERQQTEQAAQRTLANISRLTQEHASRTLRESDQALQLIRRAYERSGEALDLGNIVAQGLVDANIFHLVGIIDAHGIYRLSNLPQTPPVDLSDRAHYKVHVEKDSGQVFVSEPVLGRVSKKWTIQLTRRINRADGSFGGVAVVSVDADYFSRFYSSLDLGVDGIAALVGLDGVVRAHKLRGQASSVQPLEDRSALKFLAQGKTEGYFENISPQDHVLRLHHFRQIPDFPLWVTVALGVDEYRLPFLDLRRTNLIQASLLTLLLLSLTTLFSWHHWREERNHQLVIGSEARMNRALEGGGLALWDWDLTSGEFVVDERLAPMLGYPVSEFHVDNQLFQKHLHPDDWPALHLVLHSVLKGLTPQFVFEHRLRHKDGHWVWLLGRGKVCERDAQGRVTRMVGTDVDISERKKMDEDIKRLAYYDALTDLPNRRLLIDRLQQVRAASARSGQHGAVLFLDLDRFKVLNDTRGHNLGDSLLRQVAQRLLACVREVDTVARIGGDEFVVLLAQLSEDLLEATERARSVSEKILVALAQAYDLDGTAWRGTASIGVAMFVDNQLAAEEILKNADLAMYAAKAAGRNAVRVYDSTLAVTGISAAV